MMIDMTIDRQEVRERFRVWLLTPKEEREPATQGELAQVLGVAPSALSKMKKDPDFLQEWDVEYLTTIGSPERKMMILNTLLRTATDGDDPKHVQAAKTYLETIGALQPAHTEVNVHTGDVRPLQNLSDEELEALKQRKVDDELAARRREREAS